MVKTWLQRAFICNPGPTSHQLTVLHRRLQYGLPYCLTTTWNDWLRLSGDLGCAAFRTVTMIFWFISCLYRWIPKEDNVMTPLPCKGPWKDSCNRKMVWTMLKQVEEVPRKYVLPSIFLIPFLRTCMQTDCWELVVLSTEVYTSIKSLRSCLINVVKPTPAYRFMPHLRCAAPCSSCIFLPLPPPPPVRVLRWTFNSG